MKKLIAASILFLFSASVEAQNLDSLFNSFTGLKSHNKQSGGKVISSKDADNHKCAFGLVSDVRLNFDKFTASQKSVIASLLSRPSTDTSIVSPSGYFRIHFDTKAKTNEDNRPAYNVNELALAADSAFSFEVGVLGYPVPPGDNGVGGDDKYDIYIQNITDYGYTQPEELTPNNLWISYMVIDSDMGYTKLTGEFVKFYTTGIKAAMVTAAHEFHHAIQVGGYTYKPVDRYYHEISSTAMEEFVFGGINDYLFYQSSYFDYPGKTISQYSGYSLSIFNLYLKERFGYPVLKRIWENINNNRALKAINMTLEEFSASFKGEYSGFNTWTYFTGFRTIPGKYFKNARLYPVLKPTMSLNFVAPEKMIMVDTEPVSCNLLLYVNTAPSIPDSVYAIVSNSDYKNGYEDIYSTTHCDYYLSSSPAAGARKIYSDYYVRYQTPVPEVLKDINVVNNELIGGNVIVTAEEIGDPFPQPFNYSRHNNVAIPAAKGVSDESLLYIYTMSMKLVYSGSLKVIKTDKLFVRWNGLDDSKSRLPNGVYFYVTKRDDTILKGKLVIQNE